MSTLLLRGGRLSGGSSDPIDILIVDGRIARIGSDLRALDAEVTDLDGRWLVPGLWDNHVHFSLLALHSQRLDLSLATSAAAAASAVGAALTAGSPTPLVGSGFRDGLWPDAPNLAVLDAASGVHPVVLLSGDLHAAWLNSAALAQFGHAGHPTGLLREDDAFAVNRRVSTVADLDLDRWADAAARQAASRGVVGIVDLEMAWNLEVWERRMVSGSDSLRVEFGIYTEHLDRAINLGLRTGVRVNDLLSVGPFKVLIDGSLNTRTAYCRDGYPGLEAAPDSHGMLTLSSKALVALIRRASGAGILPAVHAIGDHANSLALDAFEEVGCRGRIEHAQLVATEDLPRFAWLGVEASVQPDHAIDDRDVADHYWPGRTARAFAYRSLLDAGATLRFGSDAPVSALDPWSTMAAAVSRTRDDREPWHPEQRVSTAEALAASTRTRIEFGAVADLVVTDVDPITASAEQLRRMPVAATLLGGRFTHNQLVDQN